jgi:hypothetical protein
MGRPKDPELERVWRRRLERQSISSLSVAVFCARESVSVASFHYWKRRLVSVPSPNLRRPPLFVPLHVGPQALERDQATPRSVEVDLPHHVRVRFDAPPDPEWLGRVVAALASLPDEEATS